MPIDIKKQLKQVRSRNYLSKDFDSFRAELLSYARIYFPDKIKDFSEASLGGLLLDMAAMVGDSLSFYMDHQFNELNPLTAIETNNIINHLKSAGVPIVTASPASVTVNFSILVPSETDSFGERRPKRSALPIIGMGTVLRGNNGIKYNLVEELNFSRITAGGDLFAAVKITEVDSSGLPSEYLMSLNGICLSGREKTEAVTVGNVHVPFREMVLAEPNVTDIISVVDSNGNVYHEVSALTEDVIFGGTPTIGSDNTVVEQEIEIIPAPHRFVRVVNPKSKITSIQFGSGRAETLDNDIVPDPSDLALPLYGKKTFPRFVINPNSLLDTQTLGISPTNTTLRIKYRHGGGLSHNIGVKEITTIDSLIMTFEREPLPRDAESVRTSITVINLEKATGGLPSPTLEDLRASIPATRHMQSRIVSRADLLARIYTLPSRFGRVFRAGINANPNNPLASVLHVISKDENGYLVPSSDPLKKNLSKYLNEYRLVSDAVDVVDTQVLNFGIQFKVIVHPHANKHLAIQNVINKLKNILVVGNFQINQPIILAEIINIVINADDVISLVEMPRITSKFGSDADRVYGYTSFRPANLTVRGMVVPPPGGIFELKYPDFDIVGTAA